MTESIAIIACYECDRLQQIPNLSGDGIVRCARCGAVLRKFQRIASEKSIEYSLALALAAGVLFVLTNVFPVLGLQIEGRLTEATLFAGVIHFFEQDMNLLAGLVFLTCIAAPLLQIAGLLYILLPLYFNRLPKFGALVYRSISLCSFWNMLEVLVLGILVSMAKLAAMATIIPGVALWTLGALVFVLAAIASGLDSDVIWAKIGAKEYRDGPRVKRGTPISGINCESCHLFHAMGTDHGETNKICFQCGAALHSRKPDSLSRSLALLTAAVVLYIPANILPVMNITSLGTIESDTIMSGVLYLETSGTWPLALIVFVASIFVPALKMIILSFLIVSVKFKFQWRPTERTRMYRLIEAVGKWSMVDIYVVTLMSALVQAQGLAEVDAGVGAVAFGAVVVLTVFATKAFDTRLIWDSTKEKND